MTTILERVLQVSANELNLDLTEIKPDSSYAADLGADSLDMVELEMAIEKEFCVVLPESKGFQFKTPDDFAAWLEHDAATKRRAAPITATARDKLIEGRIQELRAEEHRYIDSDSRTIEAALMLRESSPPTDSLYGDRLTEAGFVHNSAIAALRIQLSKAKAREAEAEAAAGDATDQAIAMSMPAVASIPALFQTQIPAPARRRGDRSAPTLKLGEIQKRLGMRVTEVFLTARGFPPAAVDQGARLYHEADFAPICSAISSHALTVGTRNWLELARARQSAQTEAAA